LLKFSEGNTGTIQIFLYHGFLPQRCEGAEGCWRSIQDSSIGPVACGNDPEILKTKFVERQTSKISRPASFLSRLLTPVQRNLPRGLGGASAAAAFFVFPVRACPSLFLLSVLSESLENGEDNFVVGALRRMCVGRRRL
jgi:hypothetical protein